MTGTAIVQAILDILFAGLTQTGTAIGAGISSMVTSLVYTTSGNTTDLSPFFILVVVFAAISLGLSLCRWVLNFATSFGNRNR